MDDAQLAATAAAAAETERLARAHMAVNESHAAEYVMAAEVRRQAIALRRACEKWTDARAYRSTVAASST